VCLCSIIYVLYTISVGLYFGRLRIYFLFFVRRCRSKAHQLRVLPIYYRYSNSNKSIYNIVMRFVNNNSMYMILLYCYLVLIFRKIDTQYSISHWCTYYLKGKIVFACKQNSQNKSKRKNFKINRYTIYLKLGIKIGVFGKKIIFSLWYIYAEN